MNLAESLERPLIITAAITGSITTRDQHPRLPVTPVEIAESSIECLEAGASVVHIHVREKDGTPSARVELYEEVVTRIRDRIDGLINITTGSGAGRFSETERLVGLSLAPEIASFDAGSMNFGARVFENSPAFLRRLAEETTSRNILPEIECFDTGMIGNALRLGEEGLLPGPGAWWFQFCLGVRGGAPADPTVLLQMRNLIPVGAEWSVLGVGRAQLPLAFLAMTIGGHVRTGLEDNVYYRPKELVESNAQFVRRLVMLAEELGRPVATPRDARALLRIESTARVPS